MMTDLINSDLEYLDIVQKVAAIFAKGGDLSHISNYEHRPQQEQMAQGIMAALEKKNSFIVEAPTGVGKSLAYLVPAILFSLKHQRKAIISTQTINLQEQLFQKDLPFAQEVINLPFTVALLKGRQHYLCTTRLRKVQSKAKVLFNTEESAELARIIAWADTTKTGCIDDISPRPDAKIWQQVCSEPHICSRKNCPTHRNCFYQLARQQADDADILIVNHTLFFALLGSIDNAQAGSGFLYPDDFVIFDEAHSIEKIATQQLGSHISQRQLTQEIHRLYHPKTTTGLLLFTESNPDIALINNILQEITTFFEGYQQLCTAADTIELRITQPNAVVDNVSSMFANLHLQLEKIISQLEADSPFRNEYIDVLEKLKGFITSITIFNQQKESDFVYWVAMHQQGTVSLHYVPINASKLLQKMLFVEGKSTILTSATLSTKDNDLSYFKKNIGAYDVNSLTLSSPYNFAEQMQVFCIRDIVDPRHDDYRSQLVDWVKRSLLYSDGHAFVLFTSYSLLSYVAEELETFILERGWQCLIQGRVLERTAMIAKFKKADNSVLFGTNSFWEGVDIPGAKLSNIIIVKLPFSTPDNPLVQAKLEYLEKQGNNPFITHSLPEAIMFFKQGVGRLIRSKQDQGMISILDSRIIDKHYGRQFLQALPQGTKVIKQKLSSRQKS